MKALYTKELVSLWSGSKKFININGHRLFAWQEEDGLLFFRWDKKCFALKAEAFRTDAPCFIEEVCRIVSLIFWWPEK